MSGRSHPGTKLLLTVATEQNHFGFRAAQIYPNTPIGHHFMHSFSTLVRRYEPIASSASARFFTATTSTPGGDRKSTRLNSSHVAISYAVFCLKKKKYNIRNYDIRIKRLSI